jgi:hypothetical protein
VGLEAPWALLAALLAAAPIVAHLVRRRDLPRVALPTIVLLRRAQVASQRRTRIVDLLLLLVRIALIVAMAIALAAPYRTVRLTYGDGERATVALVLDDSLSMGRRGLRGDTPFAEAIARAREVLQTLPAGSEAAIVLGGRAPRVLVARTTDLAAAARQLSEIGASVPTRGTDLVAALPLALRELAGGRAEARRVLVLTDGAAHARAETLEVPGDVALELERFGPRSGQPSPANVSIASASAVPDPMAPGSASVLVELRASGPAPTGVLALKLERADTTLARAEATFSGGVARVTLRARLADENGDPTARVQIEARDALGTDDTRGVLLRPRSAVRVLVVSDGSAAPPVAQALALAPDRESAIEARLVDPDTLGTMDLSAYDAVLLAGVAAPDAATARALRAFVERGGGLIVAAGEAVDARALEDALGPVLPARPRGAAPAGGPLGLRSGTADGALSDVTGLGSTSVRTRLLVEAPRGDVLVPLAFTDDAPALMIGRAGAGRVALLATSLDESWCDLPLRPGFLPLVARLVREVAPAVRAPDRPIIPGETVDLPLPPGAARLVVTAPDGERESFEDLATVAFSGTARAGAYRVQVADRGGALRDASRLAFVVAAPASESELRPGPEVSASRANRGQRAAATVVKHSLAPWFFLLIGLLALAEGALRFPWSRGSRQV